MVNLLTGGVLWCNVLHNGKGKETHTMTNWTLTGYADGTAQTPWANAPRSFDEWMSNPIDTPADVAYWKGFNASTEDAYRKAGA